MKRCSSCKRSLPTNNFIRNASKKDGLECYCKNCSRAKQKKYYQANREKIRAKHRKFYQANQERMQARTRKYYQLNREKVRARDRKSRYGLNQENYEFILKQQYGLCAICRENYPTDTDHDHLCCPGVKSCGKCVRGLLCGSCNRWILGGAKENIEILRNAIRYLQHHKQRLAKLSRHRINGHDKPPTARNKEQGNGQILNAAHSWVRNRGKVHKASDSGPVEEQPPP